MEFYLKGFSEHPYKITAPERIRTPRLMVFQDRVQRNIQRMYDLIRNIAPDFEMHNLCPHVKTHKCKWTTQQLIAAGVDYFKATPNEVEMLLHTDAKKIFVAYPLLTSQAEEIAHRAKEKNVQIYVHVGHLDHAEILISAAQKYNIQWRYYIDLDVGMHRTGVRPEQALQLYQSILKSNEMLFMGFHAYDGQNHQPDLSERKVQIEQTMKVLTDVVREFESHGIAVPEIITGGTPNFLMDLEFLYRQKLKSQIILSPGTWIYFDSYSYNALPDSFEIAACILAQVIDRPSDISATLNLGHKRWAIDKGPVDIFSVENMHPLNWSEEHTVVTVPEKSQIKIGDYVLFAPRHVCSTVNMWDYFILMDENGDIADLYCPVEGRNR